jgi:hypothetical protein
MQITLKKRYAPFPAERLEAISKVLADTAEGLTGSDIDHLLRNSNIPNPTPDMTKWKRLYNAFVEFQNEHQVGNHVIVFIHKAMDPARVGAHESPRPGIAKRKGTRRGER